MRKAGTLPYTLQIAGSSSTKNLVVCLWRHFSFWTTLGRSRIVCGRAYFILSTVASSYWHLFYCCLVGCYPDQNVK
ncbi:hypothetical protein ARMSODRAFT_628077 [Armillaria solidipes]|uniref:Uncharacterized protein n=1 Tax=Armillaria solidipes TaxID=1076256 RepID=A0A2H3C4R6_9AGAR|nr:hypothetical protein ARMSODRAFT_628077 [Armillaria solidipes]